MKELFDVTVKLHHETPNAILVSDNGEEKNAVWLPLSQIEINERRPNGILDITLPFWLAKDKRLI